jgi:uncharacterized protein YyaL (SSP411 family)
MLRAARSSFVPRHVLQQLSPGEATQGLPPALAAMLSVGRAPRGYACVGLSCSAPAEDAEAWRATLEGLGPSVAA